MKIETQNFTIETRNDNFRGYFEHKTQGEDYAGGLWFETSNNGALNRGLIDYDGVYYLPSEVAQSLRDSGFYVDKEYFEE